MCLRKTCPQVKLRNTFEESTFEITNVLCQRVAVPELLSARLGWSVCQDCHQCTYERIVKGFQLHLWVLTFTLHVSYTWSSTCFHFSYFTAIYSVCFQKNFNQRTCSFSILKYGGRFFFLFVSWCDVCNVVIS
jgi:hypothetical protein